MLIFLNNDQAFLLMKYQIDVFQIFLFFQLSLVDQLKYVCQIFRVLIMPKLILIILFFIKFKNFGKWEIPCQGHQLDLYLQASKLLLLKPFHPFQLVTDLKFVLIHLNPLAETLRIQRQIFVFLLHQFHRYK